MKYTKSILTLFLLLCLLLPLTVLAEDDQPTSGTCGASCTDNHVAASGHSYKNGICTVCEAMDAYTALDAFEYTVDEQTMTITLSKYVGAETSVTVPAYYVIDGTRYVPMLQSNTVFCGNTSLTSVTLRSGVRFVDNTMYKLFAGCSNLTTVDMTGVDTANVVSMRELFSLCKKLACVYGYENWDTGNVESIFKAFNQVQKMDKIDLSGWNLGNVKNSGWCFQLCYATEILLPENLAIISSGFLNHATKVAGSTFTIPKGVVKIGYGHTIYDFATDDFAEFIVAHGNLHYKVIDGILYSMDGTEMLAIPRNKPFDNGVYEIPEGVTFLGELSFSRNYNIETLILPDSYVIENVDVYDERYVVFEDIGNLNVGTNLTIAIYCYTGIKDYVVKDTNPNYVSVDGILYSKDMTTLVAIPTRYGRLIDIPEGVTTWNKQAMWNDTEVTDLYADNVVDKLLSACGGIKIPSTMIAIEEAQLDLINRLKYKFGDSFVITVTEKNPVYFLDDEGYLRCHSYRSTVTAPTCTEQGYTTHTCTECGDSYKDSYVNASHNYICSITFPDGIVKGHADYTCTACGDSYQTAWLDPSAYEGLTLACIGDSITAGVGVTANQTDYVYLLAQQLGMDYIRLGASGTTLCTDGSRTCNIGKLTEGNLMGADVVTILMGINDFCAAGTGYYVLGDIESTDTSTIYGAVKMWCQRIAELRQLDSMKDTQFYFVTPVITSWNNSVSSAKNWDQSKTNIHGYTLRDLCNAIIEVCALYDVPVVDLNLISGLYYVSAEDNSSDLFGGDGVHPGATGHEMMAGALSNALLQNELRDEHTHTYSSWIITNYPDCEDGEEKRVCTICTATEIRTLVKTGHSYTSVDTAPTCTEQGYTTHTCTECGDSYVDDTVEALGHTEGEVVKEYAEGGSYYDEVVYCAECSEELSRTKVEIKGEYLLGDVNFDGKVDILDANLVAAYYNERIDFTDEQIAVAKVNGDEQIDIKDANLIAAYYNERIKKFPAEE